MPRATRYFYWFSYPPARRAMRHPDTCSLLDRQRMRDGATMVSLAAMLSRAGYDHGGELTNLPSRFKIGENCLPPFRLGDLLVLPTRPPLNDDLDNQRRTIERSRSSIEESVFNAMNRVFGSLNRSGAQLQNALIAKMPPENQRFGDLNFEVTYGANITMTKRSVASPGDQNTTVAYLIYTFGLNRFAVVL